MHSAETEVLEPMFSSSVDLRQQIQPGISAKDNSSFLIDQIGQVKQKLYQGSALYRQCLVPDAKVNRTEPVCRDQHPDRSCTGVKGQSQGFHEAGGCCMDPKPSNALPLYTRRLMIEHLGFAWKIRISLKPKAAVTSQTASAHSAGRQGSRLLQRLWVGLAAVSPMFSDPDSWIGQYSSQQKDPAAVSVAERDRCSLCTWRRIELQLPVT